MEEFCNSLPKIELHAHLNGSLSPSTLQLLGCLNDSVSEYQKLTSVLDKTPATLSDCFALFKVAHEATKTINNVYLATGKVIEEFAAENVIYLELRTTPRRELEFSKEEYVETVIRAIREYASDDIVVKLILCIDRRHNYETSKEAMDLIIKFKEKYPDVVKGVDLCGDPTKGVFFGNLFEKARSNGLKVTLHCAEIKNDSEVNQMFDFNPDRIGHGTCIHDKSGGSEILWNKFKKLKIPTECCLTSNVVCGTSQTYADHHLHELMENNLPFTLSTDDKGVFDTNLTKELYLAHKHFNLSQEDLWNISFDSVNMIFDDDLKLKLKSILVAWKRDNMN